MARKFEPAALAAVDAAAIHAGDRVVDLATGTGDAALLAAQRGGDVTGIDFEPALLEIAERKARAPCTGRCDGCTARWRSCRSREGQLMSCCGSSA